MTKQQYIESIQDSQDVLNDISEENKELYKKLPIKEIAEISINMADSGANKSEIKTAITEYLTAWFAENMISEIGLQSAIVQKQAIDTVTKWYS